jgi:Ca2+-binding RTX toxin-like protein
MRRLAAAIAAALLVTVLVQTASNAVPGTLAAERAQALGANQLKPAACAALTLTAVVAGAGDFTATGANELVAGGPAAQLIDAGGGDDCVLGGAGLDTLDGGPGTDVCIGNGLGTTVFVNCETAVP